jgi:peptide deformylase
MKTFKIVSIGHPVLRQKIKNVTPAQRKTKNFQKFLKDMVRWMRQAHGVGLAANQVGADKRALVMECAGNKRYPRVASVPLQTYLNARIVKYSKKLEKGWEGCLSIPGYRGIVPRSQSVTFEALTPDGKKIRKTVYGFEARIIQHEVDHLNGFFYVDQMPNLRSWTHLDEFNKHFKTKIKDRKK